MTAARRLPRLPRDAALSLRDAALFALVGLAVVGPWTQSGWLLLLDWTAGPSTTLPDSAYGLDATQIDAMPARVVMAVLRSTVGAGVAAWLPVVGIVAVAGLGASRLARHLIARRDEHTDALARLGGVTGASTSASGGAVPVVAGLAFVVNPFVFERLRAGHVLLLAGYALLPFLVLSFIRARDAGRWFRVRSAAWLALAASASPHLFWVGVVALAVTAAVPRPRLRDLVRSALIVVAAAGVYAYGIALFAAGARTQQVSDADLEVFAPAGAGLVDRVIGLVGLHGFWRGGSGTPRDVLGVAWYPLLALLLVVVGVGVRAGLARVATRVPTIQLLVLGGAGIVLAVGATGPTSALYRAAFTHVPLFSVMRESQKFLMLTALAEAVLFAAGVGELVAVVRRRSSGWASGRVSDPTSGPMARALVRGIPAAVMPLAAAVLLVALTPTLLGGLGGQVETTEYPASWTAAEQAMGSGPGAVLMLPWHEYQAFPFTDGRTVRTPAAAFFSRPVIGSDAVELPGLRSDSTSPRSAYLDQLLSRGGQLRAAGRLLAPLGVAYVVVARATEPGGYGWLDAQRDLDVVLRTDDLVVYRNTVTGLGRVVGARTVSSIEELIDLANRGVLGSEAALPTGAALPAGAPTPVTGDAAVVAPAEPVGPQRVSPVAIDVPAGPAGWVTLPEVASGGWRVDGTPGVRTVAGTVAMPLGSAATSVTYRPWAVLRAGYLVSAGVLVLLLVVGLVEHRADGRPARRSRPGSRGPGRSLGAETCPMASSSTASGPETARTPTSAPVGSVR